MDVDDAYQGYLKACCVFQKVKERIIEQVPETARNTYLYDQSWHDRVERRIILGLMLNAMHDKDSVSMQGMWKEEAEARDVL